MTKYNSVLRVAIFKINASISNERRDPIPRHRPTSEGDGTAVHAVLFPARLTATSGSRAQVCDTPDSFKMVINLPKP